MQDERLLGQRARSSPPGVSGGGLVARPERLYQRPHNGRAAEPVGAARPPPALAASWARAKARQAGRAVRIGANRP